MAERSYTRDEAAVLDLVQHRPFAHKCGTLKKEGLAIYRAVAGSRLPADKVAFILKGMRQRRQAFESEATGEPWSQLDFLRGEKR